MVGKALPADKDSTLREQRGGDSKGYRSVSTSISKFDKILQKTINYNIMCTEQKKRVYIQIHHQEMG